MNEYRIKRATKSDWQVARDVRLKALADTPDAFGTLIAADQARPENEWIARVCNPIVAHFLAFDPNGNAVGTAVGAPYSDVHGAAGLYGMWVDPEHRGRRVGQRLVGAVMEWARAESYKCVLLDVDDDNTAAIRLYESSGFLATGQTGTLPPPREHVTEHQRSYVFEK